MGRIVAVILTVVIAAACAAPGVPIATAPTIATTTSLSTSTTTTAVPNASSTEPTEPSGDLMVLGDWGSGTLPQGAVAGAMERLAGTIDVAAIVTTGDNFYEDDIDFLMAPFGWATNIEFWIAWGNHDIETARRIDAVNRAFSNPPRWTIREWGTATLVFLDSNQVEDPQQIEFLKEAMTSIDGPTIVVFHHPSYSCSKHGDTAAIKTAWVPLFDSDVLLVMSGHDHNYQRINEGGITYVVTGGGGRPLYDLEPCDREVAASAELHHFVLLQQTDNAIHGTAIDVNGTPFDEFAIDLGTGGG